MKQRYISNQRIVKLRAFSALVAMSCIQAGVGLLIHNMKHITFLPPHTHTHTHTRTRARPRKDVNSFAFSPLNLSNPLIFRIIKYAKVTEVNH